MAVVEPNVFEEKVAYDSATGQTLRNAEADVYAQTDTSFTTPLALQEMDGTPLAKLRASDDGIFPAFKVDSVTEYSVVNVKSGSFVTPIRSLAGLKGDPGEAGPPGAGADPAGSSIGQVLTSTGPSTPPTFQAAPSSGSGISGAPANWPSQFPPTAHSHTATQVSDATTVGRNVMTAVDAQVARSAIGAGTGNGTSNLALGTTGSTAAPGNHVHGANALTFTPGSVITATNVQAAIEQAAATGGSGSGNSEILVWKYQSGQYPALAATKPAGVKRVEFEGPVQPTNANVSGGYPPAWIGNGTTQATAYYEYNPGLS